MGLGVRQGQMLVVEWGSRVLDPKIPGADLLVGHAIRPGNLVGAVESVRLAEGKDACGRAAVALDLEDSPGWGGV